ncbi:hypothetical protein DEF23_16235 [Marinitenerispora sediminis]|uniref:Uncharacterized protein n=1 Tax=Marinitenerispora sediminis TaxID=1931232 RepID=A0A368T2A3_9ACTN|nr:hypothetical protein DEF28_12350 [Marinitenerispora sediminis]RCV54266.1 hypothetical protein DEF23_16235 [Marinitenerispora sediminis]RCV54837.1 hypothetical protein DEF24_18745 [Marinitenerispora sediminis]
MLFSDRLRPFREDYGEDDPVLDLLVTARGEWARVQTSVRTFNGDGLCTFLFSAAEDFRGWAGARTWHSIERQLTLSAEHRSGGHVHLTWGVHGRPPYGRWDFATTTVHAAGEEMRKLASDFREFFTAEIEQP